MKHGGRKFWDASVAMTVAAQRWHKAADIASPYENNPLDLTLFVSCDNEELSVEATLDTIIEAMQVIGMSYEIIIIDDGSRDRSVELLRRYVEAHPDIAIVLRANTKNKGLAQNYVDAAFIGCGKYYRLVSGENAEPMETMIDVFKAIGEADIVVPYYVASLQEGVSRQLIAQVYTRLLNLMTGNCINDYNGSPVHLRFNVMRWHPNGRGFGFRTDLLCRLLDLGFTCKQVPCRNARRRHAIGWKQLLSVAHSIAGIMLRRASDWMHGR